MDNIENSFTSHLRQPSRIPSPGKLTDITVSANNARTTANMLPPPPGGLKRKTLQERAGEPTRPAPGPPSSRPVTNGFKTTSTAGTSRHVSHSSSVSSRPQSASSARNVSNSSFSSSVGSGSRPPSAQSFRPQSAMLQYNGQKPAGGIRRPASSFDNHVGVPNARQDASRNSMTPFSSLRKYPSSQCNSTHPIKSLRDISLSNSFSKLSLNSSVRFDLPEDDSGVPCSSPSQIPKRINSKFSLVTDNTPSPSKSPRKIERVVPFLTRESNIKVAVWDPEARLENVEYLYAELKQSMSSSTMETTGLKESINLYKARICELDMMRTDLADRNAKLQKEMDGLRAELNSSSVALDDARRNHKVEVEDIQRQHRRNLEQTVRDSEEEVHRLVRQHRDETTELRRRLEDAIEDEKERRRKEVQALSSEGAMAKQRIEVELEMKHKAFGALQEEVEKSKADAQRERDLNMDLRAKLSEAASNNLSLEASMRSLKARIEFLESDCKSQSQAFADLEQKTQDAIKDAALANEKLRIEETLRRKLHNQVQELKGNIRVFCRVRPSLGSDSEEEEAARITFPDDQGDSKEVEVLGPQEKSSLGNVTRKKNAFTFDRVFGPSSQNADVFDEISQLVQSALDGYNVCIFCYGQTGAGKTFTMSSEDGMIPRAVRQIYDTARSLGEKGWRYSMEGSFVEVYNENINDLLGKADEFDKKRHEIRHDMQRCKTTITDITTVNLDSPSKVEMILRQATANRSVAATKANERSSRSHSVFILKLIGENGMTGEKSEGTLNLVDLAGSERLSHSGSTGERLKETQNINKSLSCLGDVIGALGQGKEGGHVPYRNSKLTYLLQFSLGGNSKTLMFVMISPLQAHLNETLTSLKFATKVHNTHIGTARRQAKIREA